MERLGDVLVTTTVRRDSWSFQIGVSALLEAARQKLEFHRARHAHWTTEVETLKAELPNSIDVPELMEIAASYSNRTSNYGNGVQIDPRLQQKLSEAFRKVTEHADKVTDFQRWERFLKLAPATDVLEITYNDATFFGL